MTVLVVTVVALAALFGGSWLAGRVCDRWPDDGRSK